MEIVVWVVVRGIDMGPRTCPAPSPDMASVPARVGGWSAAGFASVFFGWPGFLCPCDLETETWLSVVGLDAHACLSLYLMIGNQLPLHVIQAMLSSR